MSIDITSLIQLSIGLSLMILLVIILEPLFKKVYHIQLKCWIWLIISIRLIIPFNLDIIETIRLFIPSSMNNSLDKFIDTSNNIYSKTNPLIVHSNSYITQSTSNIQTHITQLNIIGIILLVGMVVMFTYNMVGYYYSKKQIIRWSLPSKDQTLINNYLKIKQELNITKDIKILISKRVASPMLMGIIEPILLMPSEDYSESDQYYILKHELVHYKRKHLWFKLILMIAKSVHWFNPIVHIMCQKISKDIEICCDYHVVSSHTIDERKLYGNTIINSISMNSNRCTALTTYFNPNKNILRDRLRGVLDMNRKRNGILILAVILLSVLTIGEVLTYGQTVDTKYDTKVETTKSTTDISIDKVSKAVLANNLNVVKDAVKAGVDLNKKDSNGQYPLEITLIMTNCDAAKLLISGGADVNKITKDGKSIYDKAMESDSKYYKKIFESAKK